MVLLIVVGNCLVGLAAGEVHRADYLLDEGNLTRGESIFRVEVIVRPPPRPLLGWHEGVDFARRILGWLVQKDQEASQPTGVIPTPVASTEQGRIYKADLEVAYVCPNQNCGEMFIAYFLRPPLRGSYGGSTAYVYRGARPVNPTSRQFDGFIQATSPDFCSIYNEAHKAEQFGLTTVCVFLLQCGRLPRQSSLLCDVEDLEGPIAARYRLPASKRSTDD